MKVGSRTLHNSYHIECVISLQNLFTASRSSLHPFSWIKGIILYLPCSRTTFHLNQSSVFCVHLFKCIASYLKITSQFENIFYYFGLFNLEEILKNSWRFDFNKFYCVLKYVSVPFIVSWYYNVIMTLAVYLLYPIRRYILRF